MVNEQIKEVIFIGMPGPTHHYGGLSGDNVASSKNRGNVSNPRLAALQALELTRLLKRLGVEVAILPPLLRPHIPLLRERFSGTDEAVIKQAAKDAPELLEQASSSSAMWAANAATVTPAIDSADGKLHITPANLYTNLHRRIEAEDTHRLLAAIFKGVPECIVHTPLPKETREEGAANHMRLSPTHSDKGLHVFVYGEGGSARQDLPASKAIAAQHRLPDALFIKQHPDAIRAGVFHNDVIAVSNEHVLLVHEQAYAEDGLARIADAYGKNLTLVTIGKHELSLEEAVHTYVFNSQIVTTPGGMAVIAPMEAKTLYGGKAAALLARLRAEIHYLDLHQSMRNGGGPACLRLRVPMTEMQLAALKTSVNVLAEEPLLATLEQLIDTHYPEQLSPKDLGNPVLYEESKALNKKLLQMMRISILQ